MDDSFDIECRDPQLLMYGHLRRLLTCSHVVVDRTRASTAWRSETGTQDVRMFLRFTAS